jgi:hypothetical protein
MALIRTVLLTTNPEQGSLVADCNESCLRSELASGVFVPLIDVPEPVIDL